MNALIKRIKKRINMTIMAFKKDCRISLKLAFLRVADDLLSRRGFKKISKFFHSEKDKFILEYLEKGLSDIIEIYKNNQDCGKYSPNAPIWICWWTGEETAPELVKKCIQSIRKNAGAHPVNFIDKFTYSQYIDIPDYMLKKIESGNMGLAHLSDYIRISLIEKFGGLWLDATIFCADKIPDEYFQFPFFTAKSEPTECGYLSQMRWTTFVLGGWKGNIFYKFLKNSFEHLLLLFL